jgi:hypothetical protein
MRLPGDAVCLLATALPAKVVRWPIPVGSGMKQAVDARAFMPLEYLAYSMPLRRGLEGSRGADGR